MLELEPRVLLSADLTAAMTADDIWQDSVVPTSEPAMRTDNEGMSATEVATSATTTLRLLVPSEIRNLSIADAALVQTHELVIVNLSSPDYKIIMDDLMADRGDGRDFEVVILDTAKDGLEQLSAILGERTDLDAVHIISHGDEGSISLGDSLLDLDALIANSEAVRGWGDAFTADGDLLIYGCNLAAGADGRAFIDVLGRLTGTDIAASTDLTGLAVLGGDWDLEYRHGVIEAEVAVSQELQDSWSDVLADFNETNWSGTQTYVDGATSFDLSLTGGGTIDWAYVGASDTLTITGTSGTTSSTTLSITNVVGPFNIDSITVSALTTTPGTITVSGATSLIGTLDLTANSVGNNVVVNADVTTIAFSEIRDPTFTVNGDVGSITISNRMRDATIHIAGDLDSFFVGQARDFINLTVDYAIGAFDLDSNDPNWTYADNFAVANQVIWSGGTSISTTDVVTVDALTTGDTTPQLTGTVTDPAATISVTVNGNVYAATNNGNGTWTLADNTIAPALTDGTYDVAVTAVGPGGTNETVRDEFNTNGSYSGNDGSASWTGDWIEVADSGGASTGDIRVAGNRLDIHARDLGAYVYREVDLSGATTATLTFDSDNQLLGNDRVRVDVWDGGSWTTLKTYDRFNNGVVAESFDISAYTASNTQVRFFQEFDDADQHAYFDNVQIQFVAGPSATDSTTNELVIDTGLPAVTVDPLTTTETTPQLTGTVSDPGATIEVTVNGNLYAATNNGDGTWTLANNTISPALAEGTYDVAVTNNGDGTWTLANNTISPALAEGTYDVAVSADNGQIGTDATTDELVIDLTAPSAPVVNPLTTSDTTPILTGTFDSADSASLSVEVNGVTYVLGTDAELTNVVDAWTLDLSAITPLPFATYEVIAIATDAAGNSATDSSSNELVITNTPTVTINPLTTNDTTPRLTGTVSDPLATIEVTVDGNLYAATNNGDGTWTLADNTIAPALTEGTYDVAVSADNGQIGTDSTTNELVIDLTAPTVTVATLTTNNTSPALSGTVDDAAATINVLVDGNNYAATNNGDGTWSLAGGTIAALAEGTYEVVVTATDAAGNAGTDGTNLELVIDTTAPSAPTVNALTTSDTTPILTGTFDSADSPGLSVAVDGTTYVLGTDTELSTSGDDWTLDLSGIAPLAEATYEVTAIATDAAGNPATDATSNELVIAPNAPPTAADNTVVTLEDTDYTFTVADFNFSDVDGDSLTKVQITKLETVGALQLSGADVTLDQEILVADITAGNLKFVPVPGQSGVGYASFEFRVHDGIEYSAPVGMTTLINATFDADAEGFTYADDTFGTALPAWADGIYDAAGGLTGGGLRVDLAGGATGGPVSGGWSDTFNLAQAETVTVSLQYRMIMSEMYEANEFGEIILEVDGVRYGADVNTSLIHNDGDGNGGAIFDSGWLFATFDIALGAGAHTITVGAYNNDSTTADEYVQGFFDDINVTAPGSDYTMTVDVNTLPVAADDPVPYSNYVNTLNPLGYWRLDESSGTIVYDETGTNDGTYINGPALGQGGALAGEPAHTSVAFDGSVNDDTGDYIEIADDPSYLIDEGAIQLWFNTADVTQDGWLFSKDATGTASGGHVSISVNAASHVNVRLQDTVTSYNVESTTALTPNEWHHVVFTFGSGGMQLYVDGQLVDTDAYTGGLGTSSGGTGNDEPIVIGASSTTSGLGTVIPTTDHFDGRIDEVAMFGTELTAEQIRELYGAALQNYTIYQDTTLNATAAGGVLATDYDAEDDPLTAVLVSGPSNAQSFTLNADGSFDYTPTAGFSGTDTFTYRANDGTGDSNLATVTITVEAVVTANAVWISTDADAVAPGADGLPAGWRQGEALEFGGVDLAFGPTTDGDFSSVIDFDTFALDATDVAALHYVGSNITVGGGANTFDLQKGDILVSFNQDETILGAYTVSALDETFQKTDLLVFRPDTVGDFSSGTFHLLLDDVVTTNLRGITLVEQNTTVGDANLTAGSFLLTRDTLPFQNVYLFDPTGVGAGTTTGTTSTLIDGAALNIDTSELRGLELIEQATSIGGVILDAGTLLFSLRFDDAAVGGNNLATTQQDIFAVTVTKTGVGTTAGVASMLLQGSDVGLDGVGGSENIYAIAMVPDLVNALPTAADNTVVTLEDTDYTFTVADFNFSDPDAGDTLNQVQITSLETAGALQLSGVDVILNQVIAVADIIAGNLTFTPAPDVNGAGYANFQFLVHDGIDFSVAAYTMTIDVTAVPDVTVDALLTNSTSPQLTGTIDDPLATIDVLVDGTNYAATNNGDGTWSLAGGTIAPALTDGTYDVAVSATNGEVGTDSTTNELVIDTTGPTVTVTPLTTNDTTPILTGTVSDPAATILVTVDGNVYAATNNGDGTWTLADNSITPALADGTYDVAVSADNGSIGTDATTDELVIDTTGPSAPVVNALTTSDTTPILTGTYDATDSVGLSVTVNLVAYVLGSDAELTTSGNDWTLNLSAIAPLAVATYEVIAIATDGLGNAGSDSSTDELVITANTAPVAVDDNITVTEDVTYAAIAGVNDLLLNDSDPDGDALSVDPTPVAGPSQGSVILNADGTFTYIPNANFNGSDAFTYRIMDGNGGIVQATVLITVDPVDDAPVVTADSFNLTEDSVLVSNPANNVLLNDVELDGEAMFVNTAPVTNPTNGVLILNSDGTFSYTPDADFNGVDGFSYQVADSSGSVSQGTVTITVDPVDDPPVGVADNITADGGIASVLSHIALTANDANVDGDTLTITNFTQPSNGSVFDNGDGTFTYIPAAGFSGVDSFVYTVADPDGNTSTAAVIVTVTAEQSSVIPGPDPEVPPPVTGQSPPPDDDGTAQTADPTAPASENAAAVDQTLLLGATPKLQGVNQITAELALSGGSSDDLEQPSTGAAKYFYDAFSSLENILEFEGFDFQNVSLDYDLLWQALDIMKREMSSSDKSAGADAAFGV